MKLKFNRRCLMCRMKLKDEWYCGPCRAKKERIERDEPRVSEFRSMPLGALVIYGHVLRKSLGRI